MSNIFTAEWESQGRYQHHQSVGPAHVIMVGAKVTANISWRQDPLAYLWLFKNTPPQTSHWHATWTHIFNLTWRQSYRTLAVAAQTHLLQLQVTESLILSHRGLKMFDLAEHLSTEYAPGACTFVLSCCSPTSIAKGMMTSHQDSRFLKLVVSPLAKAVWKIHIHS